MTNVGIGLSLLIVRDTLLEQCSLVCGSTYLGYIGLLVILEVVMHVHGVYRICSDGSTRR